MIRLLTVILLLPVCGTVSARQESELDFRRDVRPLLAAHCFHCHGPDETTREADLRLDQQEGIEYAFGDNDWRDSEGWRRLNSADPDEQMPPPGAHADVKPDELSTLKAWIQLGAPFQSHWSWVTPERPDLPNVVNSSWVQTPVDAFVLNSLESKGWKPNAQATREQLIRRLTLDLTGLPPTLEDIDGFLSDTTDSAYEKVVDRLLASPRFGERMAVPWLDAARYADTNGFSIDDHRDMWLWREWVIDAFNKNMPYDQFVTEQMAGDLLPDSTADQKLATGFLRNSMNTHEGGTLPEEYRVIYIADKIDTVSTVFMGLTLRCAQCHDHKYDPFSQKDYYRLYAFFDTAFEPGNGAVNGNTDPFLRVDGLLTEPNQLRRDLEERIATLRRYQTHPPELLERRSNWEQTVVAEGDLQQAIQTPLSQRSSADWAQINEAFAKTTPLWNRHVSTLEREIAVLERDLKEGQASVMVMKEQGPRQTYVLTRGQYNLPDQSQPVRPNVPAALPPLPTGPNAATAIDHVPSPWKEAQWVWDSPTDRNDEQPRYYRFPFDLKSVPAKAMLHITADNRCETFINGKKLGVNENWMVPAEYDVSGLLRSGENLIAVEASNAGGPAGLIAALVDDRQQTVFATGPGGLVSTKLLEGWPSPDTIISDWASVSVLGPAQTAPWHLDVSAVQRDTSQPSRLDLAYWLVDPNHPLTARVAVNRIWQTLFGLGLVETPYDFGSQGSFPSLPELLDWLACEYSQNGWDTKALIKTIVMSATYQQSATVSAEQWDRDPKNRWLGRGSRYRLPGEFIRDGALSIAGILNPRIGGPSVYPNQPHGLWREISHFGYGNAFSAQAFYPSDSVGQNRRSMYTFWKRTSPPPSLIAFDAPTREVCAVLRSRTNTPLQALVLLNDPEYVVAARELAQRSMQQKSLSISDRIQTMFRRATSRFPDPSELEVLVNRYEQSLEKYRNQTPIDNAGMALDPSLTALTVVASVILNLDEVITRE